MSQLPEPELWTPEEIAEFLLNNSLSPEEYRRAVGEAFALGVDPRALPREHLDLTEPWQRPELYCEPELEQRTS